MYEQQSLTVIKNLTKQHLYSGGTSAIKERVRAVHVFMWNLAVKEDAKITAITSVNVT